MNTGPDCTCILGHAWSDAAGHDITVIAVFDWDCGDWQHAVQAHTLLSEGR